MGRPIINWGNHQELDGDELCRMQLGQDRQMWRRLVACTVEHDEPTK